MNEFNQSVPVLICKRSIQRRLNKNGFHRRIVAKTLTISLKNRKNRVQWCRNRLHWTIQEQWNKIIFSVYISNLYRSLPRRLRHVIKAKGHVTKYRKFGEYNFIYYQVILIACQTSTNCNCIT